MDQEPVVLDIRRKDLKIQALLEKVSRLTMEYENQVADLRVDLTETAEEAQRLREQVAQYEAAEEAREVSQDGDSAADDAD